MQTQISSVQDIGALVRATRKSAGIRIDDLAATLQLSKQFVSDLELGKPSVHLDKAMKVLQALGLYVYVDAPDNALQQLQRSKALIERTTARRSRRGAA